MSPADIDLIIVATATPDMIFPSTASIVQDKLGIRNGGAAFDVAAVCSGFVYGLAIADKMVATGAAPAMAPSLVPSSPAGCFVMSWTEGTGHTTVARMGRVCNGQLDAASVAQVSRAGIESGDSEIASDGTSVYVVWQEIPGPRLPSQLRVARAGSMLRTSRRT